VILDGLKVGEKVATSGNFLIDSQMQLAGKPSVNDPTRAITKKDERKGPLVFDKVAITPVGGEAGKQLEVLYTAYFEVQKALAADQTPPAKATQALASTATELSNSTAIPEPSRKTLIVIATNAEHLHHMELAGARQAYKSVSHAVVTLATQLRGEDAQQSFTHFYCPMVPDGGGDWLQTGGELANPYFGSEMLRCGEKVSELPAKGTREAENHEQHGDSQAMDKDAG
jgi:Cu(I)/Ag(I) efflux system membrane fusion protein